MPQLDLIKNIKGIATWEEGREVIDVLFKELSDALGSIPELHSLVDNRAAEPQHKLGDIATDVRDGTVKLKVSNGKTLEPATFSAISGSITAEQHGEQPASFTDDLGVHLLHPLATVSTAGFMSAADKTALAGSADPFNGTPATVSPDTAAGAGVNVKYARGDHTHALAVAAPVAIGTANAAGSADSVSRSDHVHDHGSLAGGSLHATATTSVSGFLSATDKTKLTHVNLYSAGGTGGLGSDDFGAALVGGSYYWAVNIPGVGVKMTLLT